MSRARGIGGVGGTSACERFLSAGTLANVLDNQFHHIAGVYTGSALEFYLDGVLQSANPYPYLPFNNNRDVFIGRAFGGGTPQRHFRGLVDEVEVHNRALSASEILTIFNAGSAGKCKVSDTDGDGVPDDEDNCPTIPNAPQVDTDADGSGDACDACPADPFNDGDGDGICGNVDNCPNVVNPGQEDSDGDGVGNACNEADDPDRDGFATAHDNCPAVFNPNQTDGDGDDFGDVCDVCPMDVENDADGDGICESDDNCPLTANANQFDFDQDGEGDECDPDDDNDGVLDATDQCLSTAAGATVNTDGCSIAALCPCANDWKNHGAYVSCVAHTAEDFVAAGLITDAEKDALVAEAAQSNCGKK